MDWESQASPLPNTSPMSTGEMAAHHGGWSHLDELQLSAEGSHLKGLAKSTHRVDISSRIWEATWELVELVYVITQIYLCELVAEYKKPVIYQKWTGRQGEFLFLGKAYLLFITAIKMFLIWDICPLVFISPFQWRILAETKVWNLPTWPLFWHFKKHLICVYYFSFESIVIIEHIFSFALFFSSKNNRVAAGQAFCFLGVFFQLTFKLKSLLKGNPEGYSKQILCW